MTRLERFVIVGDPHGDEINPEARESFFAFLDDFRPDIMIHGGDNWNFAYLRVGASDSELKANADADWQEGAEFFLRSMDYGKKRFFLRGNHDERLWDLLERASKEDSRRHAMEGIENINKLVRRRRVTMLPYNSRTGVLDYQGVRVVHGYVHGTGAARAHAASYGTCAFCHTHSADIAVFERWPEPSMAVGVPCLMTVDQGYNARQRNKLRHENGWVAGYTDGTKASYFQVKKGPHDKFYAPSEIKAY